METSLKITNKSNHFREFDPVYNVVTNPDSHTFKNSKRQGYEARLYYEYKSTIQKGGFCCFLTLTYNDMHMPRYNGDPCFDVEDIRFLTHGRFSREIKKAGFDMKYFVSCELGDGKGVRKGQNPHYHMLLFLVPYKRDAFLTPSQVLGLAKVEWQGFDDRHMFRRYELADHGIVRAGKFGVKVDGFRALNYCSKYVTKCTAIYDLEQKILADLWENYRPVLSDYIEFCDDLGLSHAYGIEVVESTGEVYNTDVPLDFDVFEDFDNWVHGDSFEASFFFNAWYDKNKEKVDHELRVWRNRYSDKVRISDGVGKSSVKDIQVVNGRSYLEIPSKFGPSLVPAPLYTYRQKYCTVTKDRKGNNRYVLNADGIKLKLGQYDYRIDKAVDVCRHAVDVYLQHPDAFPNFVMPVDPEDSFKKYAEYNVVYKYRRFKFDGQIPGFLLDPRSDFERFLQPAGDSDWNEYHKEFNNHLNEPDFFWYLEHPYFKEYAYFFSCIDSILNKLSSKVDDDRLEEFEKVERLKKDWKAVLAGNYH